MKQPKKLTLAQKQILTKAKLNPDNWMLLNEDKLQIVFINKVTGNTRVHMKGVNT